MTSPSLWQS